MDVTDEMVQASAEVLLADYASQYTADHLTWRDFEDVARAALEAAMDHHECIGQEEAEHMHDVMMWERQHGKRPPIIDAYGAYPDRS